MELPKIRENDYSQLTNHEPLIFEGMKKEHIRYLTLEAVLKMLSRITERGDGWGSLHLFSDQIFQRKDLIFYLNQETLFGIDQNFNIHLLYEVIGKLAKTISFEGNKLEKGRPFEIKGLVCGNEGHLWVLYHHPVPLKSKEYLVLGGRFDLYRTNKILVKPNPDTGEIISILKGRNHPQDPFQPLIGPFNIPISRLVLPTNSKKKIYIHYDLIPPIPIPYKAVAKR